MIHCQDDYRRTLEWANRLEADLASLRATPVSERTAHAGMRRAEEESLRMMANDLRRQAAEYEARTGALPKAA